MVTVVPGGLIQGTRCWLMTWTLTCTTALDVWRDNRWLQKDPALPCMRTDFFQVFLTWSQVERWKSDIQTALTVSVGLTTLPHYKLTTRSHAIEVSHEARVHHGHWRPHRLWSMGQSCAKQRVVPPGLRKDLPGPSEARLQALPDVPFFWFARVTLSQWLHFWVSITHPWNLLLPTSFRCFKGLANARLICVISGRGQRASPATVNAELGHCMQHHVDISCKCGGADVGTTFLGLHLAWAIWSRENHGWSSSCISG